ncbi:MAG: hypothetical protein ACLQAT_09325 [Candidatus Binataceae bacterium]
MVLEHNGEYHRIPEAEVEDWEALLEEIEGEPVLIHRIEGHLLYTHAYRMPDGAVYLVASGLED